MSTRTRLRTPATLFAAGLVVAIAAGCVGPDNAGSAAALDELPVLAIDEELRLGSIDDPDVGFNSISHPALDADGNLYVYDALDREIRVFDHDGTFLHRFGGPGEGPGEFDEVDEMGVFGDTVWASDLELRRITYFDRAGTLLSTTPLADAFVNLHNGRRGVIAPRAMREDRTFVSQVDRTSGGGERGAVGASDTVMVPRVRLALDGSVIDTVGFRPWPPREVRDPPRLVEAAGDRYAVPTGPRDSPVMLVLPDGWLIVDRPFASGAQAEFTVTRFAHNGGIVFERHVRYRPTPFPETALEAAAAGSARNPGAGEVMVSGGNLVEPSRAAIDAIRAAMDYPSYQLPVQRATATDDGRIWLLLQAGDRPESHWLMIEPGGELGGIVELPGPIGPILSDGSLFWTIERNELDVPWLVRYRMRMAPTGTE